VPDVYLGKEMNAQHIKEDSREGKKKAKCRILLKKQDYQ